MTVDIPARWVGSAIASGCTLPPPSPASRALWHGGRRRYAVWLIEADTAAVRALAASARRRLAPWLGPAPLRQPHITLCACGFPVRDARRADDFDAAQRRRQCDALVDAEPSVFSLRVGGIGSFNGCAYLRVDDADGRLQRLYELLAAAIPEASSQRFVPHVTLGFYRERFPLARIAEAAADLDAEAHLPVAALTLASYDPRRPDTPLRYWLRWRLT
ncbi:2'-5' RNA ligase family protein [Algiphilus aromaticivorans]|uniref:2'-5' RNA ligase family protein n=1 Tax=Algiphilus aromaticivorans TaxID=382454 RepID=UPI0006936BA9|nr:2'-5' RNA ligase family protein [Algiphilus aromaticivorans]